MPVEFILRWESFSQGEGAVTSPVLWQQRSAQVLFVADAKGHAPMSLLTVDLSICSFCFLAFPCPVASDLEQII